MTKQAKTHMVSCPDLGTWVEVTCEGYGPDLYRDSKGNVSATLSAQTNMAVENNIGLGLNYAKCMATAWAHAAHLLELKLKSIPTGDPNVDRL